MQGQDRLGSGLWYCKSTYQGGAASNALRDIGPIGKSLGEAVYTPFPLADGD